MSRVRVPEGALKALFSMTMRAPGAVLYLRHLIKTHGQNGKLNYHFGRFEFKDIISLVKVKFHSIGGKFAVTEAMLIVNDGSMELDRLLELVKELVEKVFK